MKLTTHPTALASFAFASLALAPLVSGCSGAPGEDTASGGSAYSSRVNVDANVAAFKALDANVAYVLGTDGKLWRETGTMATRTLVDANVRDFQLLDGNVVFVLGTDGKLWREYGSYTNRQLVDANVIAFQPVNLSIVYVLGSDRKLWRETGTMAVRTLVDANVSSFQAIDTESVYVLGTDANLWNETGTMATRSWVDGSVVSFKAVDDTNVYVEGNDGKLWIEHGSMSHREQVDANVAAFYPVDANVVYVKGTDGNLWREINDYHFRDWADATLKQFQPVGTQMVYVLGTDGKLWREQMPEMPIVLRSGYLTFDNGAAADGSTQIGIWPNGDYVFEGHLHDSGFVSYDDTLAWAIRASNGDVFTFAHQGSMNGTLTGGSRDDDFVATGNNPVLAQEHGLLQNPAWSVHGQVSWDVTGMENALSSDFQKAGDAISKVVSVVGPILKLL